MREYRFYTLENGNRIAGAPQLAEFTSDQEAITQGKKLLDGRDIEIWQAARVVTRLKPSEK